MAGKDEQDVIEAIHEEAEKRRKEAVAKVHAPLPRGINTIETTLVRYNIDPDILPYKLARPQELLKSLVGSYQLSFVKPPIDGDVFQQLGVDIKVPTVDSTLLALMLKSSSPTAIFESGRYPTGPNSFVPIERVAFGSETIAVTVGGVTEIAEAVLADAFEMLWSASGAIRKWDSPEVHERLRMKSFETCTKVDLGCDPRRLLDPRIVEFLTGNLAEGRRYGPAMIQQSKYDGFCPAQGLTAAWTLNQLLLKVHVFSPTTGRQETADMTLEVETMDERGRGIIDLTTELPFDIHAELVGQLVSILAGAPAKGK